MIVDKINKYLTNGRIDTPEQILDDVSRMTRLMFDSQFGLPREEDNVLRLSAIGKCLRQLSYKSIGAPANGKKMDSRSYITFYMGNATETAIIGLISLAGLKVVSTGDNQAIVEIKGIQGHPDGIVEVDGIRYLLEVKSMTSYGFADFEKGVIDESYKYQINSYMAALGLDKCIVVALNKEAGVLGERVYEIDHTIVADIKRRIDFLSGFNPDNCTLPERPYKSNDDGFYPWQCLYCPYHVTCLPEAEKVLVGRAYKLKQKKGV